MRNIGIAFKTGWNRLAQSSALSTAVYLSIVVGLGSLLSIHSNYLLRQDREQAMHSFQVMRAADQVLIGLLDAETGQRGFLISGDPAFLAPYNDAVTKSISDSLRNLEALASDNPRQLGQIAELRGLSKHKSRELASTLLTRSEHGPEAANLFVADRQGKDVMDRLREAKQAIQNSEEELLEKRSAKLGRDEQRIILIIVTMTVVTTVLRIGIAARRR